MMKKFLILFVFVFACFLKADSIFLVNNSPYALTAVIHGADGSVLGEVVVQAGEQNTLTIGENRTSLNIPQDSKASITPYYVIWKCPYGGFYSICSNISPGAMARAGDGDGVKTCQPKPKKKNEKDISCDCQASIKR